MNLSTWNIADRQIASVFTFRFSARLGKIEELQQGLGTLELYL